MEEVVLDKPNFFKKILSSKLFYIILGIVVIIAVIILSLLSYSPSPQKYHYQFCGDGTFSGQCSLTKPYLCENQTLIENDSFCGCPDNFQFNGVSCVSKYGNSSKIITFNYTLYGVNNSINFSFFKQVLNYLLSLPQYTIYAINQTPRLSDIKLAKINNPVQASFLSPLVVKIENVYPNSKDLQAEAAVSMVQNIPYNESGFTDFFGTKVRIGRYPYQVLGEDQGSCEGKSELLAYMLKQMGFGVVLFYFPAEDHEAVGIKCPIEYSYLGTGYCFVETTMPSPISFSEGLYLGDNGVVQRISSTPEIIMVSNGISLSGNLPDYGDAKLLDSLSNQIESSGSLNPLQESQMNGLRKKYNLNY